jgi:hypothetical protein
MAKNWVIITARSSLARILSQMDAIVLREEKKKKLQENKGHRKSSKFTKLTMLFFLIFN